MFYILALNLLKHCSAHYWLNSSLFEDDFAFNADCQSNRRQYQLFLLLHSLEIVLTNCFSGTWMCKHTTSSVRHLINDSLHSYTCIKKRLCIWVATSVESCENELKGIKSKKKLSFNNYTIRINPLMLWHQNTDSCTSEEVRRLAHDTSMQHVTIWIIMYQRISSSQTEVMLRNEILWRQ